MAEQAALQEEAGTEASDAVTAVLSDPDVLSEKEAEEKSLEILEGLKADGDPITTETASPATAKVKKPAKEETKSESSKPEADTQLTEDDQKFRVALKRDNWPEDMIEVLPLDRLREVGTKAVKRQSDVDKAMRDRAETKSVVDELMAEREAKTNDESVESLDDDDDLDFESEAEDHSTEKSGQKAQAASEGGDPFAGLRENWGDEFVDPIVSSLKKQNDTVTGLSSGQDRLSRQVEKILVKAARDVVRSDFPDISDNEKFKSVYGRMVTLSQVENHDYVDSDGDLDIVALMKDAAAMTFAKRTIRQQQAELVKSQNDQINGQMSSASTGQELSRGKTPEEQSRIAFERLQDGATPQEAARGLGVSG
jgi:hypothetical protein